MVAAAAVVGLAPGQAQASVGVCVASERVLWSCSDVVGTGGYVDRVVASISIGSGPTICNYTAEVRVSAYGNPRYRWNTPVQPGCTIRVGRLIVPINETFPRVASWVCVTNKVDGVVQGRDICIKLT